MKIVALLGSLAKQRRIANDSEYNVVLIDVLTARMDPTTETYVNRGVTTQKIAAISAGNTMFTEDNWKCSRIRRLARKRHCLRLSTRSISISSPNIATCLLPSCRMSDTPRAQALHDRS